MKIDKAMSVLREACGRPSSFEGTITDVLRALAEENSEARKDEVNTAERLRLELDHERKYATDLLCQLGRIFIALGIMEEDFTGVNLLRALDEIKTLRKEPRWIPCSARMPEAGSAVLVAGKATNGVELAWYVESPHDFSQWHIVRRGDDGLRFVHTATIGVITHWMPLPEPPKEAT